MLIYLLMSEHETRSGFFRGLSERSEYERPDPARPAHHDAFERIISETVRPISIPSSPGLRSRSWSRSQSAALAGVGFGAGVGKILLTPTPAGGAHYVLLTDDNSGETVDVPSKTLK